MRNDGQRADTHWAGTHEAARLVALAWLAGRPTGGSGESAQCKVKRQLCLIISQIIVSSNPLVRHSRWGARALAHGPTDGGESLAARSRRPSSR